MSEFDFDAEEPESGGGPDVDVASPSGSPPDESHPEQVVGPGDPELPPDIIEAAGKRLGSGAGNAHAGRGGAAVPPSTAPDEPLRAEVVVPKSLSWEAEKALRRADAKREPGEPWKDVPDHLLTPEMEQDVRDFFGYTASEKRTRAERQAAADRMTGRGTASAEDLQRAYELGYALEASPFGAHPQKGREGALTTAWARGVWQRQSELMPERKDSDLKAKLQQELRKQKTGASPKPKKRSGWD
jgi:rubredoxin